MNAINQNVRRCALYLRSSKDRSDVSIDAQRRELRTLAKTRNLVVVEEFADPVERANGRAPNFQRLLQKINSKDRQWGTILMLDTSRLARDQYVAIVFKHECKKRGIDVVFAMMPQLDGVSAIIMPAVLHAMDEVHSYLSKVKGLAGMAENIHKGFRAGGRAPFGYKLEQIATGAVREGEPVTKSKLILDENANKIATYLKGRAQGLAGTSLAEKLGLDLARTSLNGIEWNALTYAGHTVWNVHNEKTDGGYKGGAKRRPRSEWLMQRDTHPALITETEAEAILQRLESGRIKTYSTRAKHLLTGMLVTSAGEPCHGNGEYYRAGAKSVKAERVDGSILRQLGIDLQSDAFIKGLLKSANKAAAGDNADLQMAKKEVNTLDARIERLTDLLSETDAPGPLLRKIEAMESERDSILRKLESAEAASRHSKALRELSENDVKKILAGIAESLNELDRDDMKDILRGLIDQITLNFSSSELCIHYKIPVKAGELVASPTRFELVLSP